MRTVLYDDDHRNLVDGGPDRELGLPHASVMCRDRHGGIDGFFLCKMFPADADDMI